MKYISTRGDATPRALLRDPARGPGARRRAVPADALPAGRRARRWRAGAAWRTPTWRSRSCRSTSTTSRPPTCARSSTRPTPPRSSARDADHAAEAARSRACALEALSNGPTLAFKDMAMQLLGNLFEYELARRGETLNILGATSGDTGSAAEYAMRGKRGVRVFMLSPHGRMSPFQQAQMFSLQDANIHNIAIEGVFDDCQDIVKAVSQRPRLQAPPPHRHASTRSTGRACWRRWSTTSPATSRPRRRTTERGQLHRAVGQLRQHLRRPRGAHDGPADPPAGRWPPTRTTCSTSSSAPAPTACAAAPRRTRPRARRWTSPRRRTSSASCSTCSAATASACASCSARELARSGALQPRRRDEFARICRASASSPAAARMPTAWRRSATPAQRTA